MPANVMLDALQAGLEARPEGAPPMTVIDNARFKVNADICIRVRFIVTAQLKTITSFYMNLISILSFVGK
jgi:hypothetical protein